MPDHDPERPSLEAPKLFGRRRAASAAPVAPVSEPEPVDPDESHAVFEDTSVLTTTAHDDRDDISDLSELDEPDEPAAAPRRLRRPRSAARRGPVLEGLPAAVVAGVAGGLALVGFTWLGFRGCEAARGTTSCGTAPGMVALIVVFVLAVVVGGALLKVFRVPDPSATSFLATGLTSVVSLLVLIDYLDHWSMVIVIPAISAGTYALSWWLTTTYIDPD